MKRLVSLLFHRVVLVGLFLIIQIAILVVMLLNFNNLFLPFYGVCFALSLFAVFWITGRSGEPAYKIAWIVPILIFPIFGGLFYLLFGGNKLSRRTRRKMEGLGLTSRRTAWPAWGRMPSTRPDIWSTWPTARSTAAPPRSTTRWGSSALPAWWRS